MQPQVPTMTSSLPETPGVVTPSMVKDLVIPNIGQKFSKTYFAHIAKLPTQRVTDFDLQYSRFQIIDEDDERHGIAQLKFILRLTPGTFDEWIMGETVIDGKVHAILGLCGFIDKESAAAWLIDWLKARPSIKFDEYIGLYIYEMQQ